MKHKAYVFVHDQNGQHGLIETSQLEDNRTEIDVLLPYAQRTRVLVENLVLQSDGIYLFPAIFAPEPPENEASDGLVIPVIIEELKVNKRWVETGRVQVTKHVDQEEVVINELLTHEQVDIRRVPVDQIVSQKPEVRQEGDTLIIPLVEEELVVEKRFRLKEEIHIVKRIVEEPTNQSVLLRKEDVSIRRIEEKES